MPNKKQRQRKRRKAQQEHSKNKRARRSKAFWIQQQVKLQQLAAEEQLDDDSSPPTKEDFEVNIILSTVYLTDDYRTMPSNTKAETGNTTTEATITDKEAADAPEPKSPSNDHPKVELQETTNQIAKQDIPSEKNKGGCSKKIDVPEGESFSADTEKDEAVSVAQEGPIESVVLGENSKAEEASIKPNDTSTDVTQNEHILEPRIRITPHPSCLAKDIPGKPPIFVKDLPNGDCGDGVVNPHDKSLVADKYWAQRRRLFTKFDQGIQLDKEGWFSVTPEAIANHIAKRMVTISPSARGARSASLVIVDAFVGVGGNAIALALRPEVSLVVCVDTSQERLLMAATNARIYGIASSKMVFIHGDACDVLRQYQGGKKTYPRDGKSLNRPQEATEGHTANTNAKDKEESGGSTGNPNHTDHYYPIGGLELLPDELDGVFLSPPWGGSNYEGVGPSHYDLSCIQLSNGIDGNQLLAVAAEATGGLLAYFLPRNINGFLLAQAAYESSAGLTKLELEQNYLNRKLKTVTLYALGSVQEC